MLLVENCLCNWKTLGTTNRVSNMSFRMLDRVLRLDKACQWDVELVFLASLIFI